MKTRLQIFKTIYQTLIRIPLTLLLILTFLLHICMHANANIKIGGAKKDTYKY